MTSKSLRTTTAIFAALSLMQPLPALAQSAPGANSGQKGLTTAQGKRINRANSRSFEEICAEAKILDARACELRVRELLEVAKADAEAAAQFATEAEAAAEAATKAEAPELKQTAAKAEVQAEKAADVVTRLAAEAEAAAEAAREAEAKAEAEADANAAAQAADDADAAEEKAAAAAEADAEAKAEADANAAAQTADEAEAAEEKAAAAAEADAEAKAEANANAAAQAADEAEAAEEKAAAAAEADAEAQAEADADAAVAAERDQEPATETSAETPALAPSAADCPAEVVDANGTIRCVDALTSNSVAAIATEDSDVQTQEPTEVTTKTVEEGSLRSSDEEFSEWSPDDKQSAETQSASDSAASTKAKKAKKDSGLSDLEKAGLVALGAVVVGAILSNGQRVEANTGDRVVVVDDDGAYRVLKNDDALLGQPGSQVHTERFSDGSVRTTITRDDGTRIITIRDSTGRALYRTRIDPDGREYVLIDDTRAVEPVVVRDLPRPVYDDTDYRAASDRESLRQALLAVNRRDLGRRFSLRQVREYAEVRELAPEINLEAITFATNSAALEPSQAERLRQMGQLMRELVAEDPTELFLIEGHTDAVGSGGHNLLLSDRRAESVALAFSEYFGVPAENMVIQGYGESYLKIRTQQAERLNRRVAVRRITSLVR
jgi:outer membrane protein OmpA-like peptidoglycan-associated protein